MVRAPSLQDIAAVVLAGGFGTRVRHLLPGVPKPMAPVAGRPFLEWVVRFLSRQGIQRIIVSTGYLAEVVAKAFDGRSIGGAMVQCVPEPRPLGTAGGFLHTAQASGYTPAAWLILNGDSLVLADLAPMASELHNPAVGGALLGLLVPDTSRYGSLTLDSGGFLTGFMEKKPGRGIINGGVYLLGARTVEAFPQGEPLSFERDVFPFLIGKGLRIRVRTVEAPFLDIGTEETLGQAGAFIRSHAGQFQMEQA